MCFYPRSQMVGLLGLQAYFPIEPVDYWDAEAASSPRALGAGADLMR